MNVVNLNYIIEIKELYCATKQEEGKLQSKFTRLPPSWIWAFQVSGLPQLLRASLTIVYTCLDRVLESLHDTWLQIFQNDSKICEVEVTLTPLINKIICKPCCRKRLNNVWLPWMAQWSNKTTWHFESYYTTLTLRVLMSTGDRCVSLMFLMQTFQPPSHANLEVLKKVQKNLETGTSNLEISKIQCMH